MMTTIFHRKRIHIALSLSLFALICLNLALYTKLLESASDSLQGFHYGFFIRSSSFKRNDIVCFRGESSYAKDKFVAKRVLGIPGDKILHEKNTIRVISKDPLTSISLPLLMHTKDRHPLIPISQQAIPTGYVFLGGDHLRSFDSRYQEFGLVPMATIWGRSLWWW